MPLWGQVIPVLILLSFIPSALKISPASFWLWKLCRLDFGSKSKLTILGFYRCFAVSSLSYTGHCVTEVFQPSSPLSLWSRWCGARWECCCSWESTCSVKTAFQQAQGWAIKICAAAWDIQPCCLPANVALLLCKHSQLQGGDLYVCTSRQRKVQHAAPDWCVPKLTKCLHTRHSYLASSAIAGVVLTFSTIVHVTQVSDFGSLFFCRKQMQVLEISGCRRDCNHPGTRYRGCKKPTSCTPCTWAQGQKRREQCSWHPFSGCFGLKTAFDFTWRWPALKCMLNPKGWFVISVFTCFCQASVLMQGQNG